MAVRSEAGFQREALRLRSPRRHGRWCLLGAVLLSLLSCSAEPEAQPVDAAPLSARNARTASSPSPRDRARLPVYVHLYLAAGAEAPEVTAGPHQGQDLGALDSWQHMVDGRWADLGLPLQVMSVETLIDPGLADAVITMREATDPCGPASRVAKARASGGPGVHIYAGGRLETVDPGRFAIGGTCGSFGDCSTTAGAGDFIAADLRELAAAPHTIEHELGHLFGLAHAEEFTPCGGDLVPPRPGDDVAAVAKYRTVDNLLRRKGEPGRTLEVTAEQQGYAIRTVCTSLTVFDAEPDACAGGGASQ